MLKRRARREIRLLGVLVFLVLAGLWWVTPTPERVRERSLGSDRVLLATDGEALQVLRTDFKKRRLPWHALPRFSPALIEAVVRVEDQRFFSHPGIDTRGLLRAFKSLVTGGRREGASTITMQVSDLIQSEVLESGSHIRKRSWPHKIFQITRALGLELKWRKAEILEAYLNLIHLRGEFQGIPAFARAFFEKHPEALDRSESLLIAAMISSPNQRWNVLVERSCRLAKQAGWASSCAEIERVANRLKRHTPIVDWGLDLAPHLARRLFAQTSEQSFVRSTLDRELQERVRSILERHVRRLEAKNVHDSAALVVDNETGRVRAYVGAVSTSRRPEVDGVQGLRQAGSTLKPFLYARALESKTLTPASVLRDEATAISWSGGVYRPLNYDRHFYGPVSVREALGSSLNVPAVKLVTILGIPETYAILRSLNFFGLREPDFYGVSMALGAVDVRLEDLVNAYRTLANQGSWSPLVFRADDTVAAPRPVFSPESSFLVASILSDPHARAIGFDWENPLATPFWTAVKTGTSKDHRDNWCVGFSSRYTVGVWMGNFEAEPMRGVSGVSGAGPAWLDIMSELHREARSEAPTPPENIRVHVIRQPWWGESRREYFIAGTEPAQALVHVSEERRVQFIFPAEGSVLRLDPHQDPRRRALFIRYSGSPSTRARLRLDGQDLGSARSPFPVRNPRPGTHRLEIVERDGTVRATVSFRIR